MIDTPTTQNTHSPPPSHVAVPIAQYAHHARSLADAHARTLLRWVWSWRIIDHHIVRELLGISRSSSYRILARLRRHGLLQPVPVSGTPATPWMLLPAGMDAIAPHLDPDDLRVAAVTTPGRIHVAQVQHDLIAQLLTIRIARTPPDAITTFIDEARARRAEDAYYPLPDQATEIYSAAYLESAGTRLETCKVPDAIIEVVIDRGADVLIRIAVECQQTVEPAATVNRVMAEYCAALASGDIDAVIYCSTRPNIPPIYRAAMSPALCAWVRTPYRRWVSTHGPTPYREWMSPRVMTMDAPEFESWYYLMVLSYVGR